MYVEATCLFLRGKAWIQAAYTPLCFSFESALRYNYYSDIITKLGYATTQTKRVV